MRREIDQHAREFDECHVRFWQGYVTGQFYVRDPRDGAVVASPAFRTWRPPWHPRVRLDDSPEAARAFEALRYELTRLGWSSAPRTGSWTERVFVRSGASTESEAAPI